MGHSRKKRKREHRRKLAHRRPFRKNGYSTPYSIWDEVWNNDYGRILQELGFTEEDRVRIREFQGPDVLINGEPVLLYEPPVDEGVFWRRANPIPGVVLSSRVERPQAPADSGD